MKALIGCEESQTVCRLRASVRSVLLKTKLRKKRRGQWTLSTQNTNKRFKKMYESQPIGIVDRNGNMIHEGNRIRVVIARGKFEQHTQECLVVFKEAAFQMLHDNGRTSYFATHSNIDYEVFKISLLK